MSGGGDAGVLPEIGCSGELFECLLTGPRRRLLLLLAGWILSIIDPGVENLQINDTVVGDGAAHVGRGAAQARAQAAVGASRVGPDAQALGIDAQVVTVRANIRKEHRGQEYLAVIGIGEIDVHLQLGSVVQRLIRDIAQARPLAHTGARVDERQRAKIGPLRLCFGNAGCMRVFHRDVAPDFSTCPR
jgi:hypothetical protein